MHAYLMRERVTTHVDMFFNTIADPRRRGKSPSAAPMGQALTSTPPGGTAASSPRKTRRSMAGDFLACRGVFGQGGLREALDGVPGRRYGQSRTVRLSIVPLMPLMRSVITMAFSLARWHLQLRSLFKRSKDEWLCNVNNGALYEAMVSPD